MVFAGPFRIFAGFDLVPEPDGIGAARPLRRVAIHMVPTAILQRDGEDIHDGMVQRLAARLRVHLLRVIRPGADHVMGVMAGMDDDLLNRFHIRDLFAHAEGQVNQRLGLVFGRMFLGVGIKDGPLGFARFRQRHFVIDRAIDILAVGTPGKHPGNHAVFTFIDRRWRAFTAHAAIHRFHRQLAGMGGRIGLPG